MTKKYDKSASSQWFDPARLQRPRHLDFTQPADDLAPRLLGLCLVIRGTEGTLRGGRIVETEAYRQSDEASHSYRGKTQRNQWMFAAGGCAYVYRSYGIHWCFNVVCGLSGHGEAVLIRAIEPLWGLDAMRQIRLCRSDKDLANGPGKLCQALAIHGKLNGSPLTGQPLWLAEHPDLPPTGKIGLSERIGISKGQDRLWRFFVMDHRCVSGSKKQRQSQIIWQPPVDPDLGQHPAPIQGTGK
jgi:DNA-3-methyladenine glycosylase